MKTFERDHRCAYLGQIQATIYYIPLSIAPSQIEAAVKQIVVAPQDNEQIRLRLYELWLSTKHEKMSEKDRNAMLTVFARRLSEWPPHAVDVALSEIQETSTFFPSWAEINHRVSQIAGWRVAAVHLLRQRLLRLKGNA